MYKCCFLACFCARLLDRWLRAELTFNNDLRTPKKITRSRWTEGGASCLQFKMSKLKRKSICQRHVKGEVPGTRRTVYHVDDDSVVDNHSEGDAAARASTT